MKKTLFSSGFLVALLGCTVSVSAATQILSPALENIAAETNMVKSGLICTDICFEKADFDRAAGVSVSSVTITALPPQTSGTLMIGAAPATVNQSISAANLSLLRFVPADGCMESTFRFKAGKAYSMECALKYITSVNFAPETDTGSVSTALWTQRDISVYGSLYGSDPEGDAMTFEITKYPENGLLTLTNASAGDYRYTPYDGFIGTDAFSYTVRDEYGNYSKEQSVVVKVEKPVSELVFADMEEHWAHNAALVMVADNAMDIVSVGGKIYFNPDEKISREDFLVTVMKALGAGEIEPCDTIFTDNASISRENRGYVERAYRLGVVSGVQEKDGLYFRPEKDITRAEAAVILNAIIGVEAPDSVPVFADNSSVPVWARSSLYALNSAGILNGTGAGFLSPSDSLNRAQTAQILLTIRNLYER